MSSPERLLQDYLLANLATGTPWPEGLIARYLTAGGATVDLVNERDSVVATCQGCPDWTATGHDDPTCEGRPNREWAGKCARQAAQAHADICRAMSRPQAATALPSEVRELLAAIREALDVPPAVLTDADEQARAQLLHHRANTVRIALSGALDGDNDLDGVTERLAERTADLPVTYTVWQPARDGES